MNNSPRHGGAWRSANRPGRAPGPTGAWVGGERSVSMMWDDGADGYDLGGTHPMDPGRLELTMALARDLGVLDRAGVRIVAPQPAHR